MKTSKAYWNQEFGWIVPLTESQKAVRDEYLTKQTLVHDRCDEVRMSNEEWVEHLKEDN